MIRELAAVLALWVVVMLTIVGGCILFARLAG